MSPRIPVVTAAQLIRALERDGWREARQRGSHRIFAHPTKAGMLVIPMHSGALRTGLVADTIRDAGLTADDLRRLL